jgi:RNA polymerase sigma-70 factor (sigma-E family)
MSSQVSPSAEDEFRAFVGATRRPLLRVALALTLDAGHAEDLVQTAYLRTYAKWGRLRDQDPAAYARRIVINEHTDRWRRHKGRESVTDEVPEGLAAPDGTAHVSDRDAVLRALADLTDQERRVVALRYLADQSEADTAAVLGIPRGTVKSVTHRAVARLRVSAHLTLSDEVTR